MRIIASSIIPQIEQENHLINEWYFHLLHLQKNKDDPFFAPTSTSDYLSSDNKEEETNHDSASDEEETYSISTELNLDLNVIPTSKPTITTKTNKKLLDLTDKYRDIISVTSSDKTNTSTESNVPSTNTNDNKKTLIIKEKLSNLLDLPSSWLLHLFSHYFAFSTLLTKLPLVCHQFRTLCGDQNVWKSIKFPITVIRNIYNEQGMRQPKMATSVPDHHQNNNEKKQRNGGDDLSVSLYTNFAMNYNTASFVSFLIRSCRLLQVITLEGSIEENDWNAWNHTMKILGNHALRCVCVLFSQKFRKIFCINARQIKWNSDQKNLKNISSIDEYFKHKHTANTTVIDTLFVRCRHISRRGYCWLQSLTYIPSIEHIHCAALSRSDDVQHMIFNFNHLKTLNVNILGPRHPNRNFHSHHRLALKSISHLIPCSVTEFAIPVSVQEDFVKECFSRMPLLENLDFFRLTTPHQNVDIDSWACCLSSDTIYHLANNCKNLKKCQLFVKSFKPKTEIWDSVKFLLSNCKGIHMLTIGMTESETLNGVNGVDDDNNNAESVEYDKLSKRYFDQLKKVPFLRKRFRKFKKKTMKFPKFTIMWCLLT